MYFNAILMIIEDHNFFGIIKDKSKKIIIKRTDLFHIFSLILYWVQS